MFYKKLLYPNNTKYILKNIIFYTMVGPIFIVLTEMVYFIVKEGSATSITTLQSCYVRNDGC